MPIFLGVVAVTVLGYTALRRLDDRKRTSVINSLNEFSALSGILNRGLTTVDSVRQVAIWMDSWNRDGKKAERVPVPPLGVPVPVRAQQNNNNGTPPSPRPANPPDPTKSAMVDLSVFDS